MWFYRRMLKISYLDRVQMKQQLLKITERGLELKFFGQYIRKGKLEDLCLGGKIKGKRAQGGQSKTNLQKVT